MQLVVGGGGHSGEGLMTLLSPPTLKECQYPVHQPSYEDSSSGLCGYSYLSLSLSSHTYILKINLIKIRRPYLLKREGGEKENNPVSLPAHLSALTPLSWTETPGLDLGSYLCALFQRLGVCTSKHRDVPFNSHREEN